MPELKFLGKKLPVYDGFADGKRITLNAGDSVMVSDAVAKRLTSDFPEDWIPAGAKAPVVAPPKVKEETPSAPKQAEPPEEPSGKKPKKNKAIEPRKTKRK